MSKIIRAGSLVLASAIALGLAGCGDDESPTESNIKPSFVGAVTKNSYDGTTDDLLTAGLGKSGLAGAAPAIAVPASPTAAELRKLAIYNNYRALVDVATNGGYGSLYGPNIDNDGNPTLGEGKVAGTEYLAYADDGTGKLNVTMMVQIPASFDVNKPCMVTATSSGSRGVYGAIGTSGEWGLKRGCVVAYTDKGSGSGIHDRAADTVNTQNGIRAGAVAAGKNSNFTSELTAAELAAFNARHPTALRSSTRIRSKIQNAMGGATLSTRSVSRSMYSTKSARGATVTVRPRSTSGLATRS